MVCFGLWQSRGYANSNHYEKRAFHKNVLRVIAVHFLGGGNAGEGRLRPDDFLRARRPRQRHLFRPVPRRYHSRPVWHLRDHASQPGGAEHYCATIWAEWKTSAGHDGDARKTGDVFQEDQNAGLRSLMRVLIPEKNQMGAGKTCRTDLPRPVVRRESEDLHLTESRLEMIARAASCEGASESERLGLHWGAGGCRRGDDSHRVPSENLSLRNPCGYR